MFIEKYHDIRFKFTSGVRCQACNKRAGGVPNSTHITGEAVDIETLDSTTRFKILKLLIQFGFNRIGVYLKKRIIHVDISKTAPQNVVWTE
jgi:uncharacterized protein YcbK (DUF882 family)